MAVSAIARGASPISSRSVGLAAPRRLGAPLLQPAAGTRAPRHGAGLILALFVPLLHVVVVLLAVDDLGDQIADVVDGLVDGVVETVHLGAQIRAHGVHPVIARFAWGLRAAREEREPVILLLSLPPSRASRSARALPARCLVALLQRQQVLDGALHVLVVGLVQRADNRALDVREHPHQRLDARTHCEQKLRWRAPSAARACVRACVRASGQPVQPLRPARLACLPLRRVATPAECCGGRG
mmetsp:Transcript_7284/g.22041  ORF Transcript_7284/g.22041 Transcript_7284/m.22041 type:complete len:242 (+) Transcript_7284:90-815(+)